MGLSRGVGQISRAYSTSTGAKMGVKQSLWRTQRGDSSGEEEDVSGREWGSARVLHYTVPWAISQKTDLGSDTTVVQTFAQPHPLWASLLAGEIFDHCLILEIPFPLTSFDPHSYWGRKDTSPLW